MPQADEVNVISAVQRCLDAYTQARSLEGPANKDILDPYAKDRIRRAYRRAMPFLTPGPDAIDAFLACVTEGLILEVFTPAEASKLLYATQVALTSRRARTEAAKGQSKSQPQTEDAPSMGTASSSPWVGACRRRTAPERCLPVFGRRAAAF